MRLLVVTQKVDKNDHILGFFHRWLEELTKNYESLTVICLEKGEYSLPGNVKVLSLGKEIRPSKVRYIIRFYKYIWQERNNYDAVFVHMNQEYVLLASGFWRLLGKKVFLWRNHKKGDFWTKIAGRWSAKVFHTSPHAFVARFKNAVVMPAGVDLDRFKLAPIPVESNRILVFGRIAPVKKLDMVIEGLKELELRGTEFKASIVGDALHRDLGYYDFLRDKIRKSGLSKRVRMLPAVPHSEASKLYRRYKLLINLTPDGSLDKTIFEALSSGLKVVVANSFFRGWLPTTWVLEKPYDAKVLADNLASVLPDSHNRNSETQGRISVLLKEHGLKNLVSKLMVELSKNYE